MKRPRWWFERREDELSEEMASHLAMAIQERVARGESVESATAAARSQFGNREVIRATTHDMWGWNWLERIVLEFRYASRSLRAAPRYLTMAVISLGAGLGLATAMFIFVDSIIYPAVAYGRPEQLQFANLNTAGVAHSRLPSIGEQLRVVGNALGASHVSAAAFTTGYADVEGRTRRVRVANVSPNYFAILDIHSRLGRFPGPEDAKSAGAIVVTDRFWRQNFLNRPEIGDARLKLSDRDLTVVGVLPIGVERDTDGDIWITASSAAALDSVPYGTMAIRLDRGTSSISIAPRLAAIATRFRQAGEIRPDNFFLRPAQPRDRHVTDGELLLFGSAFAVFAIACINLAALVLARGATRKRDYALRRAIGASERQIAREVLAEVAIVSALGALVGGVLASIGISVLRSLIPESMIWTGIRPPEWSTHIFALVGGGLVTAVVLAGALPAWRASRVTPSELLKSNAGTTTGRATKEFRWLMVGELALSMVLVMTAAILGRATMTMSNFSYGFEPRPLVRVDISLPANGDSLSAATRNDLRRDLLARIGSLDGVSGAASFSHRRVDGKAITSEALAQRKGSLKQEQYFEVGAGFFAATGIAIVAGRDVTEGDRATGGAAVLTRNLASSLFPAGKAIGGRIKLGPAESKNAWINVVGIAADVVMERPRDPIAAAEPELFVLTPTDASTAWSLVVRPAGATDRIDVAAARMLRDALPARARWTIAPWLASADDFANQMIFVARIFGIFGVGALMLAAAGLYSVLSHSVAQRSREFGVRIALGATRRQVLQTVLVYGVQLMAAGTIIGVLMSFWSIAVLRSLLFGLSPADPISIAISLSIMVTATLLACLAPAIRATQADPLEILRAA